MTGPQDDVGFGAPLVLSAIMKSGQHRKISRKCRDALTENRLEDAARLLYMRGPHGEFVNLMENWAQDVLSHVGNLGWCSAVCLMLQWECPGTGTRMPITPATLRTAAGGLRPNKVVPVFLAHCEHTHDALRLACSNLVCNRRSEVNTVACVVRAMECASPSLASLETSMTLLMYDALHMHDRKPPEFLDFFLRWRYRGAFVQLHSLGNLATEFAGGQGSVDGALRLLQWRGPSRQRVRIERAWEVAVRAGNPKVAEVFKRAMRWSSRRAAFLATSPGHPGTHTHITFPSLGARATEL